MLATSATALAFLLVVPAGISASPVRKWNSKKSYYDYFDLQGHRGSRGTVVESNLAAFAAALEAGATSLEMDVGITKDGHPIVWHDEKIDATKCKDTQAAYSDDPLFPYVGRNVANLTLAQIKTLDCGSLRLNDFPLQDVYPGLKLSTLPEMFDFVSCATDEPVLFNIESKINPDFANETRSPQDFVDIMGEAFVAQGEEVLARITHQSFDWRALVLSKEQYPSLLTSALCDDTTLYKNLAPGVGGNLTTHGTGPSNWLAGIDIDSFEGETVGERVARAAASIKADFLSSVVVAYASPVNDPSLEGYIPFTNQTLVDTAHSLGLKVKPWTSNRKNQLSYLLDIGVDGVITDFPDSYRTTLERKGYEVAPRGDVARIYGCLDKYAQYTAKGLSMAGYETA